MERRKTPMWTLDQALDLIRDLQPLVRELNYHITLGGGVLNTGESEKDLDLFFIPLNGYQPQSRVVLKMLWDTIGPSKSLRDNPDYGPDAFPHAQEMQKFDYLGKRIDVFIQ